LVDVAEAVDYATAWTLWAVGDANLREMELWGVPIFWWGRTGKMLTLVSLFTLFMEIVGPERISRWSREQVSSSQSNHVFVIVFLLSVLPLAPAVLFTQYALVGSFDFLSQPVSSAQPVDIIVSLFSFVFMLVVMCSLLGGHLILTARLTNLVFLLVGLHFDILAS
jgi:hypothetical protein